MLRFISSIALMLLALCLFSTRPASASDEEIWWSSAINDAKRDGYKLIDTKDLAVLVESNTDVLILDVRADYEFEAGRLPNSSNLEFDLGDRMDLSQKKRDSLEELAGQNKKRQLVIYCRSFR